MSRKLRKKEIWIYAGMTAPAILLYLFTVVGPFLTGTIPSSFRNWNIIKGVNQWNGIANYVRMFTKDQVFLNSIGFTIKLGLGSLIFVNSFALAAALMLEGRNVRARSFARSLFFLPNVISGIIIAYTWIFVYGNLLPSIGNLLHWSGLTNLSWFGTPRMAMLAILIVDVWKSLGFQMIIYINGLQNIPGDVLEAASIDGCTGLNAVRRIKLPLLMPSITVCLLLTIIGAFKSFDLSFALTNGGPMQSTQTIAYNIYTEAFTNNRMGYACAKSMVMMGMISVVSLIQLKLTRSREVQM